MEEPTIPEMLRDLQADVSRILANLDRYVTQEQRAADQKVLDLRLEAVNKQLADSKAKADAMKNLVWSAVVAPVIVGFILYWLIGKGS